MREESGGNIKNKQEDGSGLIKRTRNERHSPPGSTCYKTASQTIRKCSLRLKKNNLLLIPLMDCNWYILTHGKTVPHLLMLDGVSDVDSWKNGCTF